MQLIILSLIIFNPVWTSRSCFEKSYVATCDYVVSHNPIAVFTFVQRVGETLDECLNLFDYFDWSIGFYCPDLSFCGLGFDLTLDYRSKWNREEFAPARGYCYVITDKKQTSCDDVENQMHAIGVFSS